MNTMRISIQEMHDIDVTLYHEIKTISTNLSYPLIHSGLALSIAYSDAYLSMATQVPTCNNTIYMTQILFIN